MRVLNIGCGNDTFGTDFVDLYPMRAGVIKCDVNREKLPFRANTFDVVYSSFVFEHLTNPGNAVKEMFRVLKKGGKVEIHTNNAGWIFYHNSKSSAKVHYGGYETSQNMGGHTYGGMDDRHYSLYTWHHMENHLKDAGFSKIETRLYRKAASVLKWQIRFINWLLENSRLKWAAYPHIAAIGYKS